MNPRARLLALHALTCVTAFLLCLAGSASGKAALSPEKTASGDFFEHPGESTWQTAPESLQPQWEIDPSPTQTASGRQVWLSPDPIESVTGEMAEMLPEGPGLYGYVGNDPIARYDPDGLRFAGLRNLFNRILERGRGKGRAGAGAPCPKKFGTDMGAGGRRLAHMQGMGKALTGARPPGVPADWVYKAGKGGVGHRWINPNNKQEVVRVMPGNPKSPHANSQSPYCRRTDKAGKSLDKDGNIVEPNSPEAHIPLMDFWYW